MDMLTIPPPNWRHKNSSASLEAVFRSVAVPQNAGFLRKAFAFLGPGFLVSVGYMDPGNWATSIAAGAKFGYALLWIAMLSNIMAIILQALAGRLAVASGRDLAQACRDAYGKPAAFILWLFAEVAIIATDIAEVIGTAIGLNLLFGIALELGVIITALDVFIVLMLQRFGFRKVEAFVLALLAVIFVSFIAQMALAKPEWSGVLGGFIPTTDLIHQPGMLYLALGIIGATVMPHNLYLHSGIVQTRDLGTTEKEKRSALAYVTFDSTFALMLALLVNAAILILAAATFFKAGQTEVVELGDAQRMLAPLLGSLLAPKLFAIALLACGLNSAVTATLAGQIVMEGFINFKIAPWARRLVTRAIAILPAIFAAIYYGASGTAFLLVFSQVVLAFQLPFAIIPLIQFTASKSKMGALVSPLWLTLAATITAAIVIVLNVKLIWDVLVS